MKTCNINGHLYNWSLIGMLILQDWRPTLFYRLCIHQNFDVKIEALYEIQIDCKMKCQPRIPGVIFLISEFPLKQQVSSTARTRLPTSCTVRWELYRRETVENLKKLKVCVCHFPPLATYFLRIWVCWGGKCAFLLRDWGSGTSLPPQSVRMQRCR